MLRRSIGKCGKNNFGGWKISDGLGCYLIRTGQELSFRTHLVASRPASVIRVTFAVCHVLEV